MRTLYFCPVVSFFPRLISAVRVLPLLLQRRRSPEANQTLHDIWPSHGLARRPTFSEALAPRRNFARCKVHFTSKSCVLVYWHRYCTALHAAGCQTLQRGTRNGITELSQRTQPIFGRAAITLGIGPHSSFCCSTDDIDDKRRRSCRANVADLIKTS